MIQVFAAPAAAAKVVVSKAAIVAAMLALVPKSTAGEAPDDYRARLDGIAEQVDAVAEAPRAVGWRFGRIALIAAVVEIFGREALFDRRVHAGERHPRWTQDDGRATCLGQLHRGKLVMGWESLAGLDAGATLRCTWATARMLAAQAAACAPGPLSEEGMARTFAAYGAGHCVPPDERALRRAREWAKTTARLGGATSMLRVGR